jgi:hypothetical protein
MMIKVYQIQLTDAEVDAINNGETSDRIKAYFDRSFESTFKSENFQHYTHVANVDVDGFEQAFVAMNLWEESSLFDRVELVGSGSFRCSSMSVGDIVADHDGTLYRCASFGFTKLEDMQYA